VKPRSVKSDTTTNTFDLQSDGAAERILCAPVGAMLIELMVATLIFSFVAASGMRFLILQHGWAVRQEEVADTQQQIRTAMDFMERELGLLGYGLSEKESGFLEAGAHRIEFLANLNAAAARLTAAALPGQTGLIVRFDRRADSFGEGKIIQICGRVHCEQGRLARDGGTDRLELEDGITAIYEVGSAVQVLNRVQYELRFTGGGPSKLIRTVDGGANAVAEGISSMELEYRDDRGEPTANGSEIRQIRIRLNLPRPGSSGRSLTLANEIYLRNE